MKKNYLSKIINALELVNSNINLKDVLNNIVAVALELTDAERGTIYLVDKERDEVRSLVATGVESLQIVLKLGEGLAGHVAKTGQTINIKDVNSDPRFNKSVDKKSGFITKNMICFPIKDLKSEIVGVLQLLNSRNNEFSEIDEEYLRALSIHAALAINNALMMQKQIESNEQLKIAKQEAEKFALLRAHFLTQMSHEIRTPLNIILSGIDYLRMKTTEMPVDEFSDVFEMLQGGSDRITRTIDSIIELSKLKSGSYESKIEIFDLEKDVLLPLINSLEMTALQKGIQIKYSKETEHTVVKKDKFMLSQIFREILDNAIKFTDNGSVTISIQLNKEKQMFVSIKDTGIGISKEFQKRIFEPFSQEETGSSRKYEGNGLALALVNKYAELNNLKIHIESEKNWGTTFSIIFDKEK